MKHLDSAIGKSFPTMTQINDLVQKDLRNRNDIGELLRVHLADPQIHVLEYGFPQSKLRNRESYPQRFLEWWAEWFYHEPLNVSYRTLLTDLDFNFDEVDFTHLKNRTFFIWRFACVKMVRLAIDF
jgi:hypothetical protein